MSLQGESETQWSGAEVAIVGLAGRFPGADTLDGLWSNLRGGVESVTFFTDEEVLAAGVPAELVANPAYVKGMACLHDVERFDAAFFGYAPREAEALDPAHRLFLECAWEALETAGIDPARAGGAVGVYAGVGESHYFNHALRDNPAVLAALGEAGASLASSKDFFATRAAYKLDLRGPALSVQTGCSAGLVAVHLAVQALLGRECDVALAGGATVQVPQQAGYLYAPGGIMSPDGHCRSYDARSAGTQVGSGVAVVCLKRLGDALRDGDPVRAVIRGSAINNDGAAKVAFTAPSVEGQAAVIGEALSVAGVRADTIRFVEGHGSGTDLGDPIEVEALTEAFRAHTDARGFCALGSVKSNLGHLDAAAGTAGLVKTVLALENREIPPTANFTAPNPAIDFASSPFYVSAKAEPWERNGAPRRAGVSSFGIGGTNAHVVVEEAPERAASDPRRDRHLLLLSARTPAALDAATTRLADHLRAHPGQPLADVAWTLQAGRHQFAHRRALAVREGEDAAALLEARHPDRVPTGSVGEGHRSAAFMFPGVGDQYPQMARGLYDAEPVFRAEVDRCAEILRPHLGLDLRDVLFPGDAPSAEGPGTDLRRMLAKPVPSPEAERLNRTELAQPAVFVVEYALARLWMSLGVEPEALIGHSLGEYAAACMAGVFELEDALALVAARARMVGALPAGAMLAVPLSADEVAPYLAAGVSVATINAPGMCAVAGSAGAVEAFRARVQADGHVARPLAAGHAFHSPAMEPLVAPVEALVARMRLRAPAIPMLSNVTGTWLTAAEATDPRYWARHLRAPVRFSEGVAELLREPGRVLLEVGPGQTLSTFARQHGPAGGGAPVPIIPTVRYPFDGTPDAAFLLGALGRLWLAGITPDWHAFHEGERLHAVVLPTYPWEKQRYWIDPPSALRAASVQRSARRPDPSDWLYIPAWRRAGPAFPPAEPAEARWLVFHDGSALSDAVADELRARGGTVHPVHAGERFAAAGGGFTLRPDDRGDYDALAAAARGTGGVPLAAVHLWASGDGDAERRQDAGFTSVSLLASALARGGAARLLAVTSRAQDVAGGEPVDAAKATVAAACAVAAVEHPGLHPRSVDVAVPASDAAVRELARRIADEAMADAREPAVAYRGGRRWVRAFEEARPAAGGGGIKRGGGYLLVGGLEGRNEVLADHLLERWDARLALLDQRLPHRGAWNESLAARTADDPVRRTIEWVRAREARGAEIATLQAVLTEPVQVREALAEAERRLGRLDGVIAAWDLGELLEIEAGADLGPSRWANRLERLEGRLRALEGAAEGRALDFVALESSLTPLLGGVGRARLAGAQALVDAFAGRQGGAEGTPWTAIAWDRGFPAGEAVEGFGLGPAETGTAFEHALSLGEPRVAVSTGELNARVEAAATPPPASALGSYARPEIATDYFPPATETEERIAALWQELLGIDRVGVHDDFFTLGGHSLLATQIVSRMPALFALELPLKTVFEAPTVARYARLVEDAMMAEIDAMSADEILSLA
ncbi:MAG: polyketide synthase [Gemmatimonadetes bacterium]|nr:polyketide synthase [Gemmatimonadota bacterium]